MFDIRNMTLAASGTVLTLSLVLAGASAQEPSQKHTAASQYTSAPKSKESIAGSKIFVKNGCNNCHSIESTGGCLGPPMDGVGARRSKSYMLDRITNNTAAKARFEKECPFILMEHPRIAPADASKVVAYLLTLPQPKGGFQVAGHKTAAAQEAGGSEHIQQSLESASIKAGKELFYQRGCAECHAIGNIGGQFAPDLLGIAERRDRNYVQQRITNAQLLTVPNPDEYGGKGAVMPPLNLSSVEVKEIVDFLMSLKK